MLNTRETTMDKTTVLALCSLQSIVERQTLITVNKYNISVGHQWFVEKYNIEEDKGIESAGEWGYFRYVSQGMLL